MATKVFQKIVAVFVIFAISDVLLLTVVTRTTNVLEYSVYPNGVYYVRNNTSGVFLRGAFADKVNMKGLLIINIHIDEIQPGAFENLPNLEALKLHSNDLTKIEAGVFNGLSNLTVLSFSDNKISSIASNAFDNMTSLESIVLTNNKLTHLDLNWFDHTPSLKSINFAHNLIKAIPANAFRSLSNRTQAVSIILDNNGLERIDDDAFQGLKLIDTLSLDANGFTTFSGSFLRDLQIKKLSINDNDIECIRDNDLAKVFVADITEIVGNPWTSECLEKIKTWTKKHNKEIVLDD